MKKFLKKLIPGFAATLTGFAIICMSSVNVKAAAYTGTGTLDRLYVYGDETGPGYYIPVNVSYEYTSVFPYEPMDSVSAIDNGMFIFHLGFDDGYDFSRYGTVTYDIVLEGLRYSGTESVVAETPHDMAAFIPLTGGVPVGSEGTSDSASEGTATEGGSTEGAVTDNSGSELPEVPSGNDGAGTDFVKLMYQDIENTVNEIGLASQGLNADGSANPTKTVFYSASSVNASIIKAIMKADGVTFFVTYEYNGYVFTSAITPEYATAMYKESITWYGPAYIALNCPTVMIGEAA